MLRKIFYPLLSRYHNILRRIHDLEIVRNTLLLDVRWSDDPCKYLNGQLRRQEIILELKSSFDFTEVIETGTFLGDTTGYFARLFPSPVNVKTCELDKRFLTLAKLRLSEFSNITFYQGDSREFLSLHKPQNLNGLSLIYLDAHWHSDLPLRSELQIIKSNLANSVILIDDFEVPGDTGYHYDNYGRGRVLNFDNFLSEFRMSGFIPYGPSAKSSTETGARRGSVILALEGEITKVLDGMASISRVLV